MTRRNVTSFAAILAMAVLTTAVWAQGPPKGPGGPGGRLGVGEPGGPMLVMVPAVQKELKLTDSQKSQLKKLEMSAAQKRRQTLSKNRQADSDPEKIRSLMDSQRREHEEGVAKILDKKQIDRLTEIDLQREGILAVARTDIATKLELTSDQSEKIKGIIDEMREAERKVMPRPPRAGRGPPPRCIGQQPSRRGGRCFRRRISGRGGWCSRRRTSRRWCGRVPRRWPS